MDQLQLLRRKNKILLLSLIITLVILVLFIILNTYDSGPIPISKYTDFHIVALTNDQIKDGGKTSLKDQIKVFNYGKPIHSLYLRSYVFLKLDSQCHLKPKTKEIVLKNFYNNSINQYDHTTDQFNRTTDDKNLVLITGGGKENNFLFNKLSSEFYQETGCNLQKTIYLKIEYEDDESHTKHTEFFDVTNLNAVKIDDSLGEEIVKKSRDMLSVDLEATNTEEVSKIFEI